MAAGSRSWTRPAICSGSGRAAAIRRRRRRRTRRSSRRQRTRHATTNGAEMAQRVLITGGAGFIGSHVADLFLREGWDVEILDNLVTGKKQNLPTKARFNQLDIGSPKAARIVCEGSFDVLVHLAAQMDVRKSVADPVFDATT